MKTITKKTNRTPSITNETISKIEIVLPPEIRQFITEVYQAAGLDFDCWSRMITEMLQRDIYESLTDSYGCFGIMDGMAMMATDNGCAKARKVVARWQGSMTEPLDAI
tara:strand:- start:4526 stop:4849 length:324 start_codon:yes stop_codon:yes gene_type:complete